MISFLQNVLLAFVGFSAGTIVSAGIFSFIAAIGIVPRLARRTNTIRFIPLYEDAITIGGIFGTSTMFIDYYLPIGPVVAAALALCTGIFVGCLAIALAEVLNVMPIFLRRSRITKGIPIILSGVAIGKVIGSLIYFLADGFYIL